MSFLQEGMASGPYLLLLGLILLAAVLFIVFILSVIAKNNTSLKKGNGAINNIDKENKNNLSGSTIEKKGINVFLTILVIIVIISILVLLNWVCSIKLD